MMATDATAVHAWLLQLRLLAQTGSCTAPNFLCPYHLATLALQIFDAGRGRLDLPAQVAGYASRMRLWRSIGLDGPPTINELDPKGKFVPLERLDDREKLLESAQRLVTISSAYGADRETTNSLEISLQEIMDNCFAHAEVEGPLQGLACAQS